VYKAGFAGTQEAYEKAVYPLFESLDRLEKLLTGKDYLVGDTLTEADIRLFVTIVSVPDDLSRRARSQSRRPFSISPDSFRSLCTSDTSSATCVRSGTATLPSTREILCSAGNEWSRSTIDRFCYYLRRWLRKLYWNDDAFRSTTDFRHIKVHYYWSQTKVSSSRCTRGCASHSSSAQVNPTRVVAVGPTPDIEPL
jgi:putative glutathione S-transferase